MKKRLDEIRKALQFRIQVLMQVDLGSIRDEILQSLDDITQQVLVAVLAGKDEIVEQLALSNRLASQRHDQLFKSISESPNTPFREKDIIERIKGELYYERQNDRSDDIVEAHEETFRWALENTVSNPHASNLYMWLQRGDGVYWISGKAGSGKSTLMKFLHQDAGLQDALKTWAGNARLITVSFYFWNAGSSLQKSQEGLLRSILYQMLDQEPSLGKILFPKQYLAGATWTHFPTFHELRRAVSRFTCSFDGSIKVAMLIDGLDEFDTVDLTMTELADMFIAITRSSNFKALLSSRPLAPFEYTFKQRPQLRLHHLTYNDITLYVNDKLAKHPRFAVLSSENKNGSQALIREIVTSATGVFLWVKLVVQSLLEGLQNYDRLSDLHERLLELPHDLEDLFRHMLRKIPTNYKVESSRMIQIVRCHENVRKASRDDDGYGLRAIALHFATEFDDTAAMDTHIGQISISHRQRCEEDVTGRLRSRCVGLLEVQFRNEESPDVLHQPPSFCYIEYLHKSVADFFARNDVWAEIEGYTNDTGFCAYTALLRSAIVQAKYTMPDRSSGLEPIWKLVDSAMNYAQLAETTTKVASATLLDDLDRCICIHFEAHMSMEDARHLIAYNASEHVMTWYDCFEYIKSDQYEEFWHDNFLALAIRYGLALYVQTKLDTSKKSIIQKHGRPLLDYACDPGSRSLLDFTSRYPKTLPAIVLSLLEHGADPNETWGIRQNTPWHNALCAHRVDPFTWIAVLKYLIQHGANPDANVDKKTTMEDGQPTTTRRSALRYLKRSVARTTQDQLSSWHSHKWRKFIYDATPPSDVLEQFQLIADEVIQLLIAKGAKEEEWYNIGDGAFVQVYPKRLTPSDISERDVPKIVNPGRNPLSRLRRRVQSRQI
jgi:hypothetical protein